MTTAKKKKKSDYSTRNGKSEEIWSKEIFGLDKRIDFGGVATAKKTLGRDGNFLLNRDGEDYR